MLGIMQNLALSYLWSSLETGSPPKDLRQWFINEKKNHSGKFFSYLVEPSGKVEKYYTLRADPANKDIAILESADIGSLDGNPATQLPFNRPDGPRSPQIGPVIKRTFSKQKGTGPKIQIINSTIDYFTKLHNTDADWSNYFKEVNDVLTRKKVLYSGTQHEARHHAFHTAVDIIPENKTVFLTFKDNNGRLPGEVPAYNLYLATMIDADNKYAIGKAKPVLVEACSCCGQKEIKGYPAGISKTGVNISNIDREGAFPGITNSNAFLSYAICEHCADLLFIFKFHVLGNYITYLAGQESLVLPELHFTSTFFDQFLKKFTRYTDKLGTTPQKALIFEKKKLLNLLGKEKATCTITILWSKESLRGQSIGKLAGQITDILPSRLRSIDNDNKEFQSRESPVFPKHKVDGFDFDLNLSFLQELIRRPGGEKAKKANQSRKLMDVKRMIVESIYKKKFIAENRFWEEIMVTAEWYVRSLSEKDSPHSDCLYEGFAEKKNKITVWMTFAGWIRHLAMTLHYFSFMGVMKTMENQRKYSPEMEDLKPYFTDDSGIKSDEKAFAFILGILFGRVMQIQGAKKVNVSANALTWLKRLTLTGTELPNFYNKVREKLLAYDDEKSRVLRDLIKEAGALGIRLGDVIALDQTCCCYFLLLGQSMTINFFPGKKQDS